ncbi:S1 RNA-binding domain-containing protein [Acutalibacter sp. 1XD8-36]|uniref:S1 RNA-binding domain-containing protein n=1 Tax=Acutalibacter sp. 1XD8-36 TaxID=2320852 RepID=UPI001411C839|nr:S1 RNA-binding domain-containing protein [Acutalibacter sp. 1XD8-36]NBJ90128.1 S1 RNA-binding domain-containing protein [Acutalibacter sp. 1XD8-36]
MELTPDQVSPSIQGPCEEENAPLCETDSDMALSAEEVRVEAPELFNQEPVPQDSPEPTLESSDPTAAPEAEGFSHQTDIDPAARRGPRRKTAPVLNQSDTEAAGSTPSASRRRVRRRSSVKTIPVIPIDEGRTVETAADKARNDLLDLVESQKTGRILTGTLQGVERAANSDTKSLAVLYHGAFKVIIPAEEAVVLPDNTRGRSPDEILHYMLTKRLGAEVDYIVKGVDPQSNLAVGSRLEAMAAKRKTYYFGADRDGNNRIYSDVCAEARIVSVIRAGIFVDLFGLEVYIPLRELSYQRWMDAGLYFQPGQRVLVKVLEVERSGRDNVRVVASVKQAGENPYEKALRMYSVDSCYVGTVSMVDVNGVFVALDGGVDCLCSYPKRGRPPRGARVTVRILGINHESNRIWGAITHIAAAR